MATKDLADRVEAGLQQAAISEKLEALLVIAGKVTPGPVWTPLIPTTMPKEKVKEFGKNTAFERPAQPAELAPIYVFLASQNATYITAEI